MAERLLEVFVPCARSEVVEQLLGERSVQPHWVDAEQETCLYRLIVPSEEVESLLDDLQSRLSGVEGFHVVVLATEASLPRPAAPEPSPPEEVVQPKRKAAHRISRDELYQDLEDYTRVTPVFLITIVLSALVVTLGLARDSAAIVIGAMVIAPLLGPNMALALATTLGDTGLARRALLANVTGFALSLLACLAIASVLDIDPELSEIRSRARAGIGDLVLALASGTAGALAFTSGLSATLVGVMVAVALLPPLAVAALLLVHGQSQDAMGGLLLLGTNVVCVNLAGVATFAAQGIRPPTWWEAERSARATRIALTLWVALLAVAVGLVLIQQPA